MLICFPSFLFSPPQPPRFSGGMVLPLPQGFLLALAWTLQVARAWPSEWSTSGTPLPELPREGQWQLPGGAAPTFGGRSGSATKGCPGNSNAGQNPSAKSNCVYSKRSLRVATSTNLGALCGWVQKNLSLPAVTQNGQTQGGP